MTTRMAFVVPWAVLSQAIVRRGGVWHKSFATGEAWQKSGRTGRQDKSRDVRLGRSVRWRFDFNSFDMHLAMCAACLRCAATWDRLTLLGRTHLASDT